MYACKKNLKSNGGSFIDGIPDKQIRLLAPTPSGQKDARMLNATSITAEQIVGSLLAIPAFLPATLCTGYVTAWLANPHGFRERTLVERVFWSVPLSVAISTIAAVLIGKFLTLTVVVAFFWASVVLFFVLIGREWLERRGSATKWAIGWNPLGNTALILAILWIAVVMVSLVDFEGNRQLFMSLAIFDHAPRVNWIGSVLHSGIPPANSLYWFKHASPMRYYYFWYVVCAAVARMWHLSARAVLTASAVWGGFILAAVIGIYLKHFLVVGARLRRQFVLCVLLLAVTGLDVCVNILGILFFHLPAPGYLNVWTKGQITSWFVSILWDPHHVVSMACCMFAFLLAWLAGREGARGRAVSVVLIAAALASAFGLSIFVTFAFFLLMLAWALWQIAFERKPMPALLLAAGGACSVVLLLPYLSELTHSDSKMQGGSVFQFAVREMIPPDGLLASRLLHPLALSHPIAALNVAKLILLAPGYAVELGFFFVVLVIYLVPGWRKGATLSAAHRALLLICVASIPLLSEVRSGVLETNDFGWRAALLLQFPLLLLASELLTGWKSVDRDAVAPADSVGLPRRTPEWLRSLASIALVLGVLSTLYQALMMRFTLPLVEAAQQRAAHDPASTGLAHIAYISNLGYAQLDASIPGDAIVQANPSHPSLFWTSVYWIGNDHQTVISSDQPACGAAFGGDPSGCPVMAAAIDSLFNRATAEQARAACRQFGMQYLVARIDDPAWEDKSGWVWTLSPVVADEEFRVLDCNQSTLSNSAGPPATGSPIR